MLCHGSEPEIVGALLRKGQADQPSPMLRHEVDPFGSRELRGQRQVTLILPIFIVHHHDHAPRLELRERAWNIGKRRVDLHLAIVLQICRPCHISSA